jgi:hypothetical protein
MQLSDIASRRARLGASVVVDLPNRILGRSETKERGIDSVRKDETDERASTDPYSCLSFHLYLSLPASAYLLPSSPSVSPDE